MCRCDGPAQDLAQLHQPLARLDAAALARAAAGRAPGSSGVSWAIRSRASSSSPGLDQGRQRHPQQGGQRAVAVERQPVPVGHGREEEVQQHGLARQMVAMCSRTKRRSTQDQPVAGGRRSRAGTRMRFGIMLGLLRVNTGLPKLNSRPEATR